MGNGKKKKMKQNKTLHNVTFKIDICYKPVKCYFLNNSGKVTKNK